MLSADNIFKVFKMILLEKSIFFVSSFQSALGLVIEAFLSLIFPFRWNHVLIPVVSPSIIDYLESPIPTIAGITT